MSQLATVEYWEPDLDFYPDPMDCGFFAAPPPKSITHKDFLLHDLHLEKDKPLLDTHGIQVVRHKSAFLENEFSHEKWTDHFVESNYFPEVVDLLKRELGVSDVFIFNSGIRNGHAPDTVEVTTDPNFKRDGPCGIPLDINNWVLEKPIMPSVAPKLPPARISHIDYSPDGARKLLRYARQDLRDAAADIIAAEDVADEGGNIDEYQGRRYAFLSVWRPLETILCDPIAVLDQKTMVNGELVEAINKQPGINGPFLAGSYTLSAHNADKHRWLYLKEQQPDEVLIFSLFDSYAERRGARSGTPHGSPKLKDSPPGLTRRSIEIRLVVLW
jgi:hypothetical protein